MKSALPHLGTNAGLTVMKDMILKDELPEQEIKDWLFAIALTPLLVEKYYYLYHFLVLSYFSALTKQLWRLLGPC